MCIRLTQLDAVRGASEACDQAVLLYCAGANERSNEEMRQMRRSKLKSFEQACVNILSKMRSIVKFSDTK